MTPYEQLLQEGFIHHVALTGNRRELQRRVRTAVQDAERRLEQRLINAADGLSEADINRIRRGTYRGTARLEELARRLNGFANEVSQAMRAELISAARDLAMYEAMFWQDRYERLVQEEPSFASLVNTEQRLTRTATSNVTRSVVTLGTIAATIAIYRRNRRNRLRNALVTAAQTGGRSSIMEVLTVSRTQRERGRLIGETTRSINVLSGDIHTHAASIGAQTFADSNPAFDLVWTSIIDERTSSICTSRNGLHVNRDLDGQVPPAHFNCRSIVVPIVLQERTTQGQLNRLNRETRRAIERGLPNFNSTEESFDMLSEFQQRQRLGAVRFRLFQTGDFRFPSDFIDNEALIPLDDLAAREGIDLSEFR